MGSTITNFLNDGVDEIAEYDGSGDVVHRFVPGPGINQPIAFEDCTGATAPNCTGSGPVTEYYHTDHHGSVSAMSTAAGNPSATESDLGYDGFGNGTAAANGAGQPFRYVGMYFDVETGLYYDRARYYSPVIGRFVETDPLLYKDDLNLYTYVGNDPVGKTDPTGKDTEVELQSYLLGNAPIQGDFGHQYIFMRDTVTGQTVISRGGPSEQYGGGVSGAVVNSPSQNRAGNGPVTLVTQMRPAAQSVDSDKSGKPLGTTVAGSATTLKEPIGKAEATLQKFNNAVDAAKIPYTPRSDNSNAYAGTGYQALTGKTPPSSGTLPGSNVNLKPQIPACTTDPKVCGGK